MKPLRIVTVALFLVVFGVFGFHTFAKRATTDLTMPEITSSKDSVTITAKQYGDESVLLDGLTAQDEKDGDLTDQIFVANTSHFVSVDEKGNGTIQITYAVFDKDGHCATYTRDAVYAGYHAPRFALSEPLIYTENDTITISDRVSAKDVIDGDVTSRIRLTSSSLSATNPGTYYVNAQVTNSKGASSTIVLPVIVRPKDFAGKTVPLTSPLVYVTKGADFSPWAYVKTDSGITSRNTELDRGDLDTSTPGTYHLTFTTETRDADNRTVQADTILTVVVE
ncbi:MAG TPA: hypothetical protein DDX51_06450 [Clostridiales bacterium]|nr:hypothetical protein [Clostridiales bacterium]